MNNSSLRFYTFRSPYLLPIRVTPLNCFGFEHTLPTSCQFAAGCGFAFAQYFPTQQQHKTSTRIATKPRILFLCLAENFFKRCMAESFFLGLAGATYLPVMMMMIFLNGDDDDDFPQR
jgi:hypothetical protein